MYHNIIPHVSHKIILITIAPHQSKDYEFDFYSPVVVIALLCEKLFYGNFANNILFPVHLILKELSLKIFTSMNLYSMQIFGV